MSSFSCLTRPFNLESIALFVVACARCARGSARGSARSSQQCHLHCIAGNFELVPKLPLYLLSLFLRAARNSRQYALHAAAFVRARRDALAARSIEPRRVPGPTDRYMHADAAHNYRRTAQQTLLILLRVACASSPGALRAVRALCAGESRRYGKYPIDVTINFSIIVNLNCVLAKCP